MKKKFVAILCLMSVIAMSGACSSSPNTAETSSASGVSVIGTTESSNSEFATVAETEWNIIDWGIRYSSVVINNNKDILNYCINFPVSNGKDRASGRIGYQDGDILALVAQRYNDAYDYGGNIENIFPTCFPQVIDIQEANQTSTAYDYAFDITSQELVEINGYQMCRYEGNHTYEFNHENYSHRYVAYATEVADGAYVFWMLIAKPSDYADEEYSYNLACEYALKMAYTLRTEE